MSNTFLKHELEAILNSTHDGMIAVNSEGIITIFNKSAERITGISAESVIGRHALDVIPNTRLHIVLAEGMPELNQQQEIGDTVIVTNRVPVRDDTGAVAGAVAVFRDITEIKSLADQVSDLWKARKLLEALIEATDDAISVADENGNNIIVNRAYTRITGLPKSAVLNKPATVDIAEGESMHMKVLRTGEPVRNIRMKVGPYRKEVIVNVAPIFIENRICGSVGVIHDISEMMAMNEELSKAKKLIRSLRANYIWDDIIGSSPVIKHAKEQAERAAETPAAVLLMGESGTGKELFAHAIHNASSRKNGQFVRVNCAALTETLLESELFGHEAGAFTGALRGGRKGLFEEASSGTIFLDEIGDVSMSLQSKLLRALQEKEIVRVGSSRPVKTDVRIISATNANLEKRVREGAFREDLYYRLNVFPIYIPPLRERREDVMPLAGHLIFKLNQEFGRQVHEISTDAEEALISYDWPGNVREMENLLGRAMINMRPQDTVMSAEHLPKLKAGMFGNRNIVKPVRPVQPLESAVDEAEKSAVAGALSAAGGNRTKAAELLNISLRSLYYKLKKHGIE